MAGDCTDLAANASATDNSMYTNIFPHRYDLFRHSSSDQCERNDGPKSMEETGSVLKQPMPPDLYICSKNSIIPEYFKGFARDWSDEDAILKNVSPHSDIFERMLMIDLEFVLALG